MLLCFFFLQKSNREFHLTSTASVDIITHTSQCSPDYEIGEGRLVADQVGTQGKVFVQFLVGSIELLEIGGCQLAFGKVEPMVNKGRADRILDVVHASLGCQTAQKSDDRVGRVIVLTITHCQILPYFVVSSVKLTRRT